MKTVLVTTKHRGVFFGYTDDCSTAPASLELRGCRNVVYWTTDTKGFLGLASDGPGDGCRIGPPAEVTLYDITCIANVTEGAVEKFEGAPWS